MSRDLFDPTPEEHIVVLADAAKLLKAERLSSAAGDPQVASLTL